MKNMNAKHWTAAVEISAANLFSGMTQAELRKRQDLCSRQIAMAFEAKNDRALSDLRDMEKCLTLEMLNRCSNGEKESRARVRSTARDTKSISTIFTCSRPIEIE